MQPPMEHISREVKLVIPFHLASGDANKTVTVKHSMHQTSYMHVEEFAGRIARLIADEVLRADTDNYTITVTLK